MTRRDWLAGALAGPAVHVPALVAKTRIRRSSISAITDEIGTTPEEAVSFARRYSLEWVELRGIPGGKGEYAFLSEPEVKALAANLAANKLKVSFLNTSLLKFAFPGTEAARRRQPETADVRARRLEVEAKRFERRMDDLRKAIRTAQILNVDRLRVFTGLRVAEPRKLFPRIADILGEMAFAAEKEKVQLLIENEASCNVATSSEMAALLKLLPSKAIGINWDPLNETSQKEVPFPDGYNLLPKKRVGNVQVKGYALWKGRGNWTGKPSFKRFRKMAIGAGSVSKHTCSTVP
ncbi:MAG: TIM barrel protein [Bryobacteraceae bacterium]